MPVHDPADPAGPSAAIPADRTAAPFDGVGGGEGAQTAPPLLPTRAQDHLPADRPSRRSADRLRAATGRSVRTLGRSRLVADQARLSTDQARAIADRARGAAGSRATADQVRAITGRSRPTADRRGRTESTTLEHRLRPLFQGLPPDSGLAVAVIRGEEQAVACRGFVDPATERPVRADTRFELGSITKTFTALLLAEMVARGEVRYDDPIDKYLPAGSVPGYPRERPITLLHLATHTSGLPRLPVGLLPGAMPQWFTRPCATFNVAHLLRSLARTPVRGIPGSQVRYSSLGCGLLGLLLENAAGTRYEDLLASRICGPLGLVDTSCGVAQEPAGGYRRGRRVPSFRFPALPGAAALRSSADDMLRYLQAHLAMDAVPGRLGPGLGAAPAHDLAQPPYGADTALRTALREVRRPRVAWRLAGTRICLSWKQRSTGGFDRTPEGLFPPEAAGPGGRGTAELVFHEGSTRGFVAFAGFDPAAGTGLVAMISAPPTRRRRFLQTAYETLRGLAPEQPEQADQPDQPDQPERPDRAQPAVEQPF